MTKKDSPDRDRRALVQQQRMQEAQRERRRNLIVGAVTVLIVTLIIGGSIWATRNPSTELAATPATSLAAVSGLGGVAEPPWPAPTNVRDRAAMAGLPLGDMGTAKHYHVHLDVLVNGKPEPVPANIGVDQTTGEMSYLHTHTPDGLVHIEAGTQGQAFTLGQLFTQWDVRLDSTSLGGLTTTDGNSLVAYVNGHKVSGNPALVRLRPHQEIVLVYGPDDQTVDVPESYDFAPGE